jgi:hypothetical protein
MIRRVALFLAVGTVVAATMAPAAQATPLFEATSYSAKLKVGANEAQIFKAPNSTFKCKAVSLSGTLKAATSTVTLTPTYSECTFWETPMTVKMNGCTYQIHLQKPDEFLPRFDGTLDLLCPEGKKIEFVSFFTQNCSWAFAETVARSRVTVENKPENNPDDVYLYFEVSGLTVTEKGGNSTCGEGTYTSGSLAGLVTLQAETEKGVGQNLWVK